MLLLKIYQCVQCAIWKTENDDAIVWLFIVYRVSFILNFVLPFIDHSELDQKQKKRIIEQALLTILFSITEFWKIMDNDASLKTIDNESTIE